MIITRLAKEADGPALAQLDLATWTSAVSPAPSPSNASSYVFFNERTMPGDVLVAEMGGVVAGYVKLQHPTSLPSHQHVLEVAGMAVDPSHQGTGVGRHLLKAAVRESARRGVRKLSLHVLGPNRAARRLYERCGFVTEGVLRSEFLLEDRFVDDVLMARHVDGRTEL